MGVHSDRFISINRRDYDLIISNPPVQPWLYTDMANQQQRGQAAAWNEAGADGRLVLDSVLQEAMHYLKVGGRLITSTTSRHGHRRTQSLLNQHWFNQWREIYRAEHACIQDYHGPYLQSWLAMQAQDLDLRVYQKDREGRPFAFYTDPNGQASLITLRGDTPIRWQPQDGQWCAVAGSSSVIPPLHDEEIQALQADAQQSEWYYQYCLIEMEKTECQLQAA